MQMLIPATVAVAMMLGSAASAPVLAREATVSQQDGRPQERGKPQQAQARGQQDRDRPQQAQARGQERGNAGQPQAQGQGQGQGRGNAGPPQAQGQGQGRGNAQAAGRPGNPPATAGRGSNGRLTRAEVQRRVRELPVEIRRLESSNRLSDRFVVDAAARGMGRGLASDRIRVSSSNDRLQVMNNRGDLLFDIDEDRARNLGAWQTRRLDRWQPTENAPAFCRSGAGHPVWGREWCLEKGFGLGANDGMIWSRTRVEDVVFGRRAPDRDRLDRGGLIDVLGDVVFGRLALHALTLGFDQPLAGTWVAEPNAPRLLRIDAGNVALAELVDVDHDDRVDVLYVTHWH